MYKSSNRSLAFPFCLLAGGIWLSPALAHDHHHHHHHDEAYYPGGGVFFGGMVTDQLMTNMALEYEAERQPPPVQYGDFADHRTLVERRNHPYQRTAASRLAELDKLAASGAITAKQYKDRRLAIVDGL